MSNSPISSNYSSPFPIGENPSDPLSTPSSPQQSHKSTTVAQENLSGQQSSSGSGQIDQKNIQPFRSQFVNSLIPNASEALVSILEESIKDVKVPFSLYDIEETLKLQNYNLQLRQLEAQWIKLSELLEEGTTSSISIPIDELKQQKQLIGETFNKLHAAKAEYIKKLYPNNPVYAMANPRELDADTLFFCAAKNLEKVNAILTTNGFVWEDSKPATAYGPGYQDSIWGINEMGEKGFYFSKDTPAYLSSDLAVGLECKLTAPMNGVSIMSVTELKSIGFSETDIEKGYNQLQKEYAFLQNDGLSPKDTEVVFMRPENKLKPINILSGSNATSFHRTALMEYVNLMLDQDDDTFELHKSWTIDASRIPTLRTGISPTAINTIAQPKIPPKTETT